MVDLLVPLGQFFGNVLVILPNNQAFMYGPHGFVVPLQTNSPIPCSFPILKEGVVFLESFD